MEAGPTSRPDNKHAVSSHAVMLVTYQRCSRPLPRLSRSFWRPGLQFSQVYVYTPTTLGSHDPLRLLLRGRCACPSPCRSTQSSPSGPPAPRLRGSTSDIAANQYKSGTYGVQGVQDEGRDSQDVQRKVSAGFSMGRLFLQRPMANPLLHSPWTRKHVHKAPRVLPLGRHPSAWCARPTYQADNDNVPSPPCSFVG